MFRVFIYLYDNVKRECQAGAVLKEELNDTLDSGSIVLKGIATQLDIQPLDKVYFVVEDENGTEKLRKRMLINSFQESITRKADTTLYNYSITLISETKELEGIPLPNLVITNDSNYSVLDYIKRYNNLYGHYQITDSDFSGFDTICPNLQWNAPTLREVLNDLCLIKDSVISLVNGYLKPKSINTTLTAFNGINCPYINRSQSLEDYSSELHSELGNVIDNNLSSNIKNIGFRNDEVSYFNSLTNGLKVQTKRGIYEITKFVVVVQREDSRDGVTEYQELDMTDYVKEVGLFRTLATGSGVTSESSNYQKNCVYYSRGSRNIEGFENFSKDGFLTPSSSTYDRWCSIIKSKFLMPMGTVPSYEKWQFKIEYLSIGKQTYRLSRGTNYHRIRNYRVTIDNQDNSSVDIKKFVDFEKLKLNRISNDIMLLKQVQCENYSDLATLGQTFDTDYIIFSKNLMFNRRTIEGEYYASKKYILQNIFTSIRSQKRNFEWIDSGNAAQRQEFRKIYYELSFTAPTNTIDLSYIKYTQADLGSLILNGVDNAYMMKVYAFSPFIDVENVYKYYNNDARTIKIETAMETSVLYYTSLINVDGNLQCIGNVATYNFQLDDNVFAGFEVDYHTKDTANGYPATALYNNGINYNVRTDKNFFDNLLVKFGGHSKVTELVINNSGDAYTYMQQLPYNCKSGTQSIEGTCQTLLIPMYKDNAEKLGLSFNFEWVSDNEDIEILNPAEQSLYSKKYEQIIYTQTDAYYYDNDDQVYGDNGYSSTYNSIVNYKNLYMYNNNFYLDSARTKQVYAMDLYEMTKYKAGYFTFVYDLSDDKLYICDLYNTGSYVGDRKLEYNYKIEVTNNLYIVYNDIHQSAYTQMSSYTNANVNLVQATTPATLTTPSLINIVGGSGTVDIANGYLEITPTSDEVTINNSIAIHNANSHTADGTIKIYLKIKDSYL